MMVRHASDRLFARGRQVVPDGVSSPMRAFALVGGNPICAQSAQGAQIWDVDGNAYVDFLNAFGALILGHARPEVVDAIVRQAAKGTVYGLTTELEYELAEKIIRSTPCIDSIRFVCSGTEAVMTAVRIARAHTGKSLVVKFGGAYHGHSDPLLANPENLRSSKATKGVTHGIPDALNREVLVCEYNDIEGLERVFQMHGATIAAVIVEPFATNMGFVKPVSDFHPTIRKLCDQFGAMMIFDEVVTGFRFSFGAVCREMGIEPDLITFGKIIGGGLPIGAFAGRRELMANVAIGGNVFQSGTFAANPLSMAAGNAALDVLATPGTYAQLEANGAWLEAEVKRAFTLRGIPFLFTRHGALAGVAYRDSTQPLRSYTDVQKQKYAVFKKVHQGLMAAGFLTAPSLEEPYFISTAHSKADLTRFADTLAQEISKHQDIAEQEVLLATL